MAQDGNRVGSLGMKVKRVESGLITNSPLQLLGLMGSENQIPIFIIVHHLIPQYKPSSIGGQFPMIGEDPL